MDTSYEYEDNKLAYVSSDERSVYNRFLKLAEQFPAEVTILKHPEENEGYLYASFPKKWLSVRAKKPLSEKRRQELSDRMKNMQRKHKEN